MPVPRIRFLPPLTRTSLPAFSEFCQRLETTLKIIPGFGAVGSILEIGISSFCTSTPLEGVVRLI